MKRYLSKVTVFAVMIILIFLISLFFGCPVVDTKGASNDRKNTDTSTTTTTTISIIKAAGWIGGGYAGWQTSGTALSGTGLDYFNYPYRVCTDSNGNIYVSDGNRICKWNSSGVAQGWIGGGNSGWQTSGTALSGTGLAYFYQPQGVCVDNNGNIYVADGNDRICKWNSSGVAQGWIGGGKSGWQTSGTALSGTGLAYFDFSTGVCVDSSGNIYVAETNNHRISKWNSSGIAQGWIGGGNSGWQTSGTGSSSYELAYFCYPNSVCVDISGNIYVPNARRIDKWSSSGIYQGWIGGGNSGWQTSGTGVSEDGFDYFAGPNDICIDNLDNIYIADSDNNRISKWSGSGIAQGCIGEGYSGWRTKNIKWWGSGLAFFDYPQGVCVDNNGCIYVTDGRNNRVCKWY